MGSNEAELHVEIRQLELADYEDLLEAHQLAYANVAGDSWKKYQVAELLNLFPEGQIAAVVNGKVVGCALSLIVDYAKYSDNHTYDEITGAGSFNTHDPDGDVLYGIDVFVHPDYRGLRLARRMYDVRKELCERLNLRSIIAGGRIPGYNAYAPEMSTKEYIEKVKLKQIYDAILTFQLSNGFHVKKVLKKYLPGDAESLEYATLLEWNNIDYEPRPEALFQRKTYVRIGIVQWQMRPYENLESIINQSEYFIDTVSDYQSDFILFPEFFAAPLLGAYNELNQAEAMRKVATTATELIIEKMRQFAVSYNVNIIAGSLPVVENNKLFNVAFLCRRDGSMDSMKKLHITPAERESFGMVGGNELRAFDSDCGKIAVLICYDCEFPELSRLLRDQGAEILFVPYMTDMQTGYQRVRFCAHARAVENEMYVAITGSVGNLPQVDNMDIQYSQSAIFSPSDFAFPSNGIIAESTPNTEMVLMADVDLTLLKYLHEEGSVNNLKDRRHDIFRLELVQN